MSHHDYKYKPVPGDQDELPVETKGRLRIWYEYLSQSEPIIFAAYSLMLCLDSAGPMITSTVLSSLIGTHLSTAHYAAYSIANNLCSYLCFVFHFYTAGVISQIARNDALKEDTMVGRLITSTYLVGLFWIAVVTPFLYFLKDQLFFLYLPSDAVRVQLEDYYTINLVSIPFLILAIVNASVAFGLQGVAFRFGMDVLKNALQIGFCVFFFKKYPQWGLRSALYANLIAVSTVESLQLIWIFRPAISSRFSLLRKKAWQLWDPEFVKQFSGSSGWLMGRGLFEMSQYFFTPMIVSRLGEAQLASYQILVSFFFLTTLTSNAVGKVSTIKGAEYLALKRYSSFRALFVYVPIIGFFIVISIAAIYWMVKDQLFASFTHDPLVLKNLDSAFGVFLLAVVLGSLPGPIEGLALAKRKYDFMFWTMLLAALFWGCISGINLFMFRYLGFIWGALAVFMWTRWLPLLLVLLPEIWREWKSPKTIEGELEEPVQANSDPLQDEILNIN